MKKKRNPRTKSTLILTFCLLFGWTTLGYATDEIRLRKYPKSDGQILDTVSKDREFKIVEKFGSWRYILVEGSTYGGGWVDSKELENRQSTNRKGNVSSRSKETNQEKAPAPVKKENTADAPSPKSREPVKGKENPEPPSHGRVSLGTVRIHPAPLTENPRKTEPNRLQVKDLVSKNGASDHTPGNGNKATNENSKPAQNGIDSKPPAPHNKPAPDAHHPTDQAKGKERVHAPEKNGPLELIRTAHADALPKTTVQPGNTQKYPRQASPRPQASERAAAPVPIDNTRNIPLDTRKPASSPGAMRDFLNFGFKLLSVILSCLAIIFSYKAKKMAAMSYHLVVQLQQNLEIGRRREFDERY